MLEMNWLISSPILLTRTITSNNPVIACVSMATVAKRTDFLVSTECSTEEMRMKILGSLGMFKANIGVAHNWLSYFTGDLSRSSVFYDPHGASGVFV